MPKDRETKAGQDAKNNSLKKRGGEALCEGAGEACSSASLPVFQTPLTSAAAVSADGQSHESAVFFTLAVNLIQSKIIH